MCGSISTDALQRVVEPAVAVAHPVERRRPPSGLHPVPAHRQPELGPRIAAIVDEGEELAVGHGPRCDLERLRVGAVTRRLVVEAEGAVLRRVVAELDQAALVARTSAPARAAPGRSASAGHRPGAAGLKLSACLMSVSSSSWCCCSCCRPSVTSASISASPRPRGDQRQHPLVDIGAKALHLGQRRPRDQAAMGPRILLAHALVVAVEEHPERADRTAGTRARSARGRRSRKTR